MNNPNHILDLGEGSVAMPVGVRYDFDEHRKCCRFCDSPYVAYVRHIPMRRLKKDIPLFHCLECRSFFHPMFYTEPDDQLQRDAEWHITVEERNTRYSENFFKAILAKQKVKSVLEIGCGTGTFLDVARKYGLQIKGYDTNPYAPKLAMERHGIEIDTRLWNQHAVSEAYDLICCISTFEHLLEPQLLMAEIAAYAKRHGSILYASVPFLSEPEHYHWLLPEKPADLQNPYYLSDVHINHFSRQGFETMCLKNGAKAVEFFPRGWIGYLVYF